MKPEKWSKQAGGIERFRKRSLAVLAALLLCNGCQKNEDRYTLHTADIFTFSSTTNGYGNSKLLFKINTRTGKAWVLIARFPKPYWQAIEEDGPWNDFAPIESTNEVKKSN